MDPKCNHKDPYKKEAGESESEDVTMEVELRERAWKMLCLRIWVQEGTTSEGMQMASRSWRGQGNRFSSGASRKNAALLKPWF